MRTFPSLEKPLAAGGGPGDVDEGSDGGEETFDGREVDDTTLPDGGTMEEGSGVELWASTVPRRVSRENKTEKEDTRTIFREGKRSWATARALASIIYPRARFALASRTDEISWSLLPGAAAVLLLLQFSVNAHLRSLASSW